MSLSREKRLEALQEAAQELGHKSTSEEYKALDISPSYNTNIARWGKWSTDLERRYTASVQNETGWLIVVSTLVDQRQDFAKLRSEHV